MVTKMAANVEVMMQHKIESIKVRKTFSAYFVQYIPAKCQTTNWFSNSI